MSLLWKIGGVAVLLLAAFFLVRMYGGAQKNAGRLEERSLWQAKATESAQARLDGFQAGIALQRQAETVYQRTITEKLVPITRTIVERSTAYAQTPAGAAQCLNPERVRLLDQTRAALFPAPAPAPAGGGPGAMLAYPAIGQLGWVDDLSPGRTESGAGRH